MPWGNNLFQQMGGCFNVVLLWLFQALAFWCLNYVLLWRSHCMSRREFGGVSLSMPYAVRFWRFDMTVG